jgi:modulator of FtsH protease
MGDWTGFFTAELGAAAALAGLVIVAISINVSRILADPLLPGRAVETLVAPTGVVVASSFALVPHQPDWLLGGEILATGIVMWLMPAIIQIRAVRSGGLGMHPRYILPRFAMAQLSSLPFIASGIYLFLGMAGGIYWTVPGVVVSLVAVVINAWVLLVEILR